MLPDKLRCFVLVLAIGNHLSCADPAQVGGVRRPEWRRTRVSSSGTSGIALRGVIVPVGPATGPAFATALGTEIHSAHYDVYVDDVDIYVEELNSSTVATLLEKLYATLACVLRSEPHERLRVKIFSNEERFSQALAGFSSFKRDEFKGIYNPTDHTAYILITPSEPYDGRGILLHECTHQFHFLSRTRNNPPRSAYYVEGLAEHFAMHHWNWGSAEVGTVPTIAGEYDEPEEALRMFLSRRPRSLRLMAIRDQPIGYNDYPEAWGLVSFLMDKHPAAYLKWANALDQLAEPVTAWDSAFGTVSDERIATEYVDWLKAHQEPWTTVVEAWEANDGDTLTGTASDTSMAIAVPKRNVASLSALVERCGHASHSGLVVGYQSIDHFKLIEISPDGSVWLFTLAGTKWITDPQQPVALVREARTFTVEAQKQGAWVKVLLNGTLVATVNVPERSNCGFEVRSGTASFHWIRAR